MKLSQLTPEQKTRLLAELDGWHRDGCEYDEERWKRGTETHIGNPMRNALTSYDAIIQLVQKQSNDLKWKMRTYLMRHHTEEYCFVDATPSQLFSLPHTFISHS